LILLALQSGTPLAPASAAGARENVLFFALVGMSVFFCVLIFGSIFYFTIRYRRRNGRIPPPTRQSIPLEIAWTVIPIILTFGIFLWAGSQFFRDAEPPPGAIEVYVIGKQWMWHLEHAEGQREINELHIPVDTPVRLTLASQDVIHDFFVPAFRQKRDVVPGHYQTEWFLPTKVGRYRFFCAQYCGTMHSQMIGWVYVMSKADYAAWMRQNLPIHPPANVGERIFEKLACNSCHQADHSGIGPPLAGVFGGVATLSSGQQRQVDDSFIRDIVLDPTTLPIAGYPQVMPSFRGEITEQEMLDLIAYLKSLSDQDQSKVSP
jgi:cytochrome c oxidase subunit II